MIAASSNLLETSGGSIVCISSICGSETIPGAPITYSTAKAALNFYVKSLSHYLPKNININDNFSILVNKGPGSFSSLRAALSVAKGIKIAKKAKLYGFNNTDLTQFTLDNIEVLLNKSLIENEAIKLLYSNKI